MLSLHYHLASEFNPAAFCFLHKNTAAVALKNVHRRWLLVRFSFFGKEKRSYAQQMNPIQDVSIVSSILCSVIYLLIIIRSNLTLTGIHIFTLVVELPTFIQRFSYKCFSNTMIQRCQRDHFLLLSVMLGVITPCRLLYGNLSQF